MRDAYLRSREPRKDSAHTERRVRTELDVVAALLGAQRGMAAAEITTADLTPTAVREAFADYARPRSKSTVAGCISTWNGFCRWLVREGYIVASPMEHLSRPKLPKATPKALAGGAATVYRLLESVRRGDRPARRPWPERDLAMFAILSAGGLRRDEASQLNIADLDRADGGAQLRVTGKGGAQRWVPIGDEVVAAVDAYQQTRVARFPPRTRSGLPADDAPLLLNDGGSRMTGDQMYYIVERCYRAAGVAGQVPAGAMVHALRHTYATALAEQGAAATDIQELLGHGSLATSQLYVRVTRSRLREVAALSPALGALRTGSD